MKWTRLGMMVGVAVIGWRVSRRSGASDAEFSGPMPGDDLIENPAVVWTRATTINAPADLIWPWLAQMGFGRGGWYTSRFFDRLVWRLDNSSADVLLEEFQHINVGDVIPDGPDHAAYFHVVDVVPEELIVYRSIRHPYRGHPVDPSEPGALTELEEQLVVKGAFLDFTWSWAMRPINRRQTRLLVRTRAVYSPSWLVLTHVPLGLVDFYHVTTMFRGISRRVGKHTMA